jgi:hypothetical protein
MRSCEMTRMSRRCGGYGGGGGGECGECRVGRCEMGQRWWAFCCF